MTFGRFIRATTWAIAGTLIFGAVVSETATATQTCKTSYVIGNGQAHNSELTAKVRAKDDWRDNSVSANGSGWGLWLKAVDNSMACSSTGRLGNRNWNCQARARPCK
jgi:hypothetical protein